MVHAIGNSIPMIGPDTFIAWNAEVAGAVTLERYASVWFSVSVRADIAEIYIGEGTNIQDNSVVHVDTGLPCIIGNRVTVGHGAILHSCTIKDGCLIGMGSTILTGAEIGENSMLAAASLVTQGKKFPPRSLLMGSPARLIRELSDEEVQSLAENSRHYIDLSQKARTEYRKITEEL